MAFSCALAPSGDVRALARTDEFVGESCIAWQRRVPITARQRNLLESVFQRVTEQTIVQQVQTSIGRRTQHFGKTRDHHFRGSTELMLS